MNGSVWPDGKQVAVSLSFDDARDSQLDQGVPVLNACGAKGTFYLNVERATARAADWRAAAAAGHELGNHSLRHSCSGNFVWRVANVLENYTQEGMEEELLIANQQLTNLFGAVPRTFAYPCGQTFVGRGVGRQSYVPVVARHFLAGRGFRDEFYNRPEFVDLAKVGGTEMDGVPYDRLIAHIERAAANGQWVVLVGHDVLLDETRRQTVTPETLRRLCEYCLDSANGVWLETVATVAERVHQAQMNSIE
ncbi:MAG: polysaccharide deacetylase family protein [Victivallales bacterium]|jgi:peptidoglycan-N-acetylglucosamine deacetylase|nr:polysaccharide deacetylase family protein [Victivallales bacterium]MBT7161484.1 polysaccharide deacetylase family protein [Victivallales bacterium]MBT7303325.1 polysaccharide deacetylase family protein [Victivallales bacterium]